jgi:hypothetical protein
VFAAQVGAPNLLFFLGVRVPQRAPDDGINDYNKSQLVDSGQLDTFLSHSSSILIGLGVPCSNHNATVKNFPKEQL